MDSLKIFSTLIFLFSTFANSNGCSLGQSPLCKAEIEVSGSPIHKAKSDENSAIFYYIDKTMVVFNNAVQMCESQGLQLATIRNSDENLKVYTFLSSREQGADVWTAGNDILENGNYIWGTNTKDRITYFDWITGTAPKDSECGCISIVNQKSCTTKKCMGWKESKCSEKRQTLCMNKN